jgi:prepilin-type N-terminal cleavage/methylation domain-containing protein
MTITIKRGFTLIEILLAISLIGLMFSLSLPNSYEMYKSYKASLKAQEVMIFLSSLKRESFIYGEKKVVSSREGKMMVNGRDKSFDSTFIQIVQPIEFYKNGTTSGGRVEVGIENQFYLIDIKAPLGEMILERKS